MDNNERYKQTWGKYEGYSRMSTFIMSSKQAKNNLYTSKNLKQLLTIHQNIINNVSVNINNNNYDFNDICVKSYGNNDNCFINCFMEFFNFNKSLIDPIITNTYNYQNGNNDINPNQAIYYPLHMSPYSQEYDTLLVRAGRPISHFTYDIDLPKYVCL